MVSDASPNLSVWPVTHALADIVSQSCYEKTVTLAYHLICKRCAETTGECAKCRKSTIEPQEEDREAEVEKEIEKLESGGIFGLKERERRSRLRQLYAGESCRVSVACVSFTS